MLRHFENLGATKIYESTDFSRADFEKKFREIKTECQEAVKTGKVLLYVYYAGRGAMSNGSTTLEIVFNEAEEKLKYLRFEAYLNNYADFTDNIYVLAVFDCCREQLSSKRGGELEAAIDAPVINSKGQARFIFGCRAGAGVNEDS